MNKLREPAMTRSPPRGVLDALQLDASGLPTKVHRPSRASTRTRGVPVHFDQDGSTGPQGRDLAGPIYRADCDRDRRRRFSSARARA